MRSWIAGEVSGGDWSGNASTPVETTDSVATIAAKIIPGRMLHLFSDEHLDIEGVAHQVGEGDFSPPAAAVISKALATPFETMSTTLTIITATIEQYVQGDTEC